MPTTWSAPLRDDERRNLYDPELMLEWATYGSAYCKQTFTVAKLDLYGFAVFGLAPDEVVEASAISDLLVKHGDDLFEQSGGRKIFNTMPPWRMQDVMGKQLGEDDDYSVDDGRHMVGQLSLSVTGQLTAELEAARIDINTHIARLSELLRARLSASLGCGAIGGSIFSILRSIYARAQKLHCDLAYNGKKYKASQLLGLMAFCEKTEARLVPRTHAHAKLSDVDQGCERGFKIILDKFDILIMHPKLYHAGGESMVPLNYRLHFYWGFGPAVNSKSKIFDRTHFLPDEAVSNALGSRTDASSAAKKLKREAETERKSKKMCNLRRGNAP